MLDKKSDILFLIMGTNPFPNLISAVTRLKDEGEIICICTKETSGKPYRRFKRLLNNKINAKFDCIIVNKSDRHEIKSSIDKKLNDVFIRNNEIKLLELNYTGGTKVMSSVAYDVIRNYDYVKHNENIEVNLTYIDSERESIYCEYRKKGKILYDNYSRPLFELNASCKLNIKDIISTYVDRDKVNEKNIKTFPQMKDLSNKLGNLFCNINENEYKERIKFFEAIYKSSNGKDVIKLNEVFLKYKFIEDYQDINSLGFNNNTKMLEYFKSSKWLEDYVLNKLIELKEEGIIDDVLSNITKTRADEQGEFEVDMAAYKKYKLYAISVTSIDTQENAKGKLYEIRQRAKDLAGDESGICYINLCWDIKYLEEEYRNIWDNFLPKNTLILGARDFVNLKNKLREWISGGA